MPKEDFQLVPYDLEIATIEGLKAKYMDITIPPEDKAAYAMVMSGLRECREIRLSVDAWHKDRKALIVKAGKHYDGEKNRVHGLVEPIEEYLKATRKVEDDRVEAITAEKVRVEEARVAGIRAKIEGLRVLATIRQTMTAAEITNRMDNVADIIIDEETFMEFKEVAEQVRTETWHTLEGLEKERSEWEEDQAAAKAEAERLAKLRDEQEAKAKALAEREALIEAEQRHIEAEKRAIEETKRKEQDRKMKGRATLLFSIGLGFDGEQYKYADINVHWADIVTLSDADFDALVKELRSKVAERKTAEAEQERKDREEIEARARERAIKEQKDLYEAQERATAEREEKEAAEKARKAALAPDKDKILSWARELNQRLLDMRPDLSSPEARRIIDAAEGTIDISVSTAVQKAKEL